MSLVELEPRPKIHEGIHGLSELVDRPAIELQARQLIDNRGNWQPVPVERKEHEDDARTALMEAMTASGHLSRVEIEGTLEDVNRQIIDRLLNAWDESLPWHEKQRRFAELCNELSVQEIQRRMVAGELPMDTEVVEISDYALGLDDETATSLGYKRTNYKGMSRSHRLKVRGDGRYKRTYGQISRSNSHDTSSQDFLAASGVEVETNIPSDIAVLRAAFILSRSDYRRGIIDVQQKLDEHAGPGVLYGEVEANPLHVAYDELPEESARREKDIETYKKKLADLGQQLKGMVMRGEITEDDKVETYVSQVEIMLNVICTKQPEYAEATFGAAVAPLFVEANRLVESGEHERARLLLIKAEVLKDTITFCGVSNSPKKLKFIKGLKVESYTDLLSREATKDDLGERDFSCTDCGGNITRPYNDTVDECPYCGSTNVAC